MRLFNRGCTFIVLILAIVLSGSAYHALSAQTMRAYEKAGDEAFERAEYFAAMDHYSVVLKKKPGNQKVQYKYAEAARKFTAYDIALRHFKNVEKQAAEDFPELPLRMGQVLLGMGKYQEASAYLDNYLKENGGREQAADVRQLLENSNWAMEQAIDSGITVKPLSRAVNSPYSDFAPVLVGDTLFYSSYRFKRKGRSKPAKKITRPMLSIQGRRGRPAVGRGFPASDSLHIAHTAFTPDGSFLFFNKCREKEGKGIQCEVWMTVKDTRNRWTKAQKLPDKINAPGSTTTQLHVSFDSMSNGLRLWFASDRTGGKGGMDIWSVPLDSSFCVCKRPARGKQFELPAFEDPRNEEWVNTESDEWSPFYSDREKTLYFSSDRMPGFGGLDVFKAPLNESPVNMGPSINSSYNDVYYMLYPDGQTAVLSSNRPGSQYLDRNSKTCCNDLFVVEFPRPDPEIEVDTIPLVSTDTIPKEPVPPVITEPVLKDFVGLTLYFDNDEPDKRTKRTTTKKSYEKTVLDYLERQDTYRAAFSKNLKGENAEEAEQVIDDFFDEDVRAGYERLNELCELLLTRMIVGDTVEIILKGFTSPRAKSDYNLNLGKRRISSVRNQFTVFGDGVLEQYIRLGRLKISETSFGETTAAGTISDSLKDERNSIYHPDAARERRVEIVEIRDEELSQDN